MGGSGGVHLPITFYRACKGQRGNSALSPARLDVGKKPQQRRRAPSCLLTEGGQPRLLGCKGGPFWGIKVVLARACSPTPNTTLQAGGSPPS